MAFPTTSEHVMSNSPDEHQKPASSGLPIPALILSALAVIIIIGLQQDEPLDMFGMSVPAWLPGVVLYLLGVFAGRLSASSPMFKRR